MKTNMTERDKKLLTFMFLFVVIVAIGYWGIYPQVKRYKALETKIEKETEEKKLNQMKIANLGMIEAQADEYEAKISTKKDEFYQIMNSSEIDRMMTEMAVSNNLDIYDLNFTMPTAPTDRMAYQYSALYERQQELKAEYESSSDDDLDTSTSDLSLEEDVEDSDEESSKESNSKSGSSGGNTAALMEEVMGGEEGGYQPNTDIYAVPVKMTVGGDLYDLEGFIESILKMDRRILLVGYSWGEFRDVIRRDADGNIISSSATASSSGASAGEVTDSAASETSDETSSDGVSATELSNTQIEVVTRKSLTVSLEIYMCDTASIESSLNGESENVEDGVTDVDEDGESDSEDISE
ncbi:MAG: hypothetical protein K6B68_16085 [Eubacterium sp.]|nr:hypothetical protein [Eubacterium sp.]